MITLIRDGKASPCVATIGTFDSLHIGHQDIIQRVVQKAKALSLVPTVITFEPLPQMLLRGSYARLMPFSQKLNYLMSMGIKQIVCLRFTQSFSKMLPMKFIRTVLVEKLNVRHLLIGEGFRFGYKQQGSVATLLSGAKQFGYEIEAIKHIEGTEGKISTTLIRNYLLTGDLKSVANLLGRHFSVSAKVGHGDKRGVKIGFATANLAKNPTTLLLKGVFVTKVTFDNKTYLAVANCGTRPTMGKSKPVLEVHLLDYEGDLYGKRISVIFLQKLRDEKHFADIGELKIQITKDIQATRTYFEGFTDDRL